MYRFSIQKNNINDDTAGISNIELVDGYFGKPLISLDNDGLEEVRKQLINDLQRIVLYTVDIPVSDYKAYCELLNRAHLLKIENIKISLSALGTCSDMDIAELKPIIELARCYGIKLLFEPDGLYPNFTFELYGRIRTRETGLIFNPLSFVKLSENPFLKVLYKNRYKDDIVFLRVNDGLYGDGSPVLPERGNSEIKECASALLSRSFDGYFSFSEYIDGYSAADIIKVFKSTLIEM